MGREVEVGRWWVLTDELPPHGGGVATWTASVARGLRAAGHEVSVAARRRPGVGEDLDARVIPVDGRSFGRHGGRWIARAVGPELRRGDRVLATTWPVVTGVLGRCAGLGIVPDIVAHGSDVTRPPVAPGRAGALAGGRWWAASAFLAGRVHALGAPCGVLPCPVDPDSNPAPLEPEPRWVTVARATPLKGVDRAIRLAAAADVALDVIGRGPELATWRALAAATGGRVRFRTDLGRQGVREALRGAHLALLLPRTHPDGSGAEGFGLVLAEAAAAGVATAGCRTGGVPEAAAGGLVLDDPDDVPRSLAAIRAWWTPECGREAWGWLAETHGVDRTVAALEAGP